MPKCGYRFTGRAGTACRADPASVRSTSGGRGCIGRRARCLHLAEQGVHFRHGELAAARRAVAGHGGESSSLRRAVASCVIPCSRSSPISERASAAGSPDWSRAGTLRTPSWLGPSGARWRNPARARLRHVPRRPRCQRVAEKTAGMSRFCVAIWRLSKAAFSFSYRMMLMRGVHVDQGSGLGRSGAGM